MIPYILRVTVLLTACFLFYKIFLQKETFYRLNRWMLVVCLLVSFGLPLLPVPQTWSWRSNYGTLLSRIFKEKTAAPTSENKAVRQDYLLLNMLVQKSRSEKPAPSAGSVQTAPAGSGTARGTAMGGGKATSAGLATGSGPTTGAGTATGSGSKMGDETAAGRDWQQARERRRMRERGLF